MAVPAAAVVATAQDTPPAELRGDPVHARQVAPIAPGAPDHVEPAHAVHDPLPALDEVPMGQLVHTVEPAGAKVPAGHWAGVTLVLALGMADPAGCRHEPWPVLGCQLPGGQTVQLVDPAREKEPAGQEMLHVR